jgi:hypothetical protein
MLTIYVLPKFIRNDGNGADKRATTAKNELPSTFKPENQNSDMLTKDHAMIAKGINSMEPDESSNFSSSCSSSFNNSLNDINKDVGIERHHRKSDTNYLLKDLISKEVNKIKGETDNLSNLLKEKIEAANIEGFIDKTVCGIVELKDDLMRMNEPEVYSPTTVENLRRRNITQTDVEEHSKGPTASSDTPTSVDAFLLDAIKKEVVIPAVLSNANSAK